MIASGPDPCLSLLKYISLNKGPLPLIVITFHLTDEGEAYYCKKAFVLSKVYIYIYSSHYYQLSFTKKMVFLFRSRKNVLVKSQ